MEDAHVTQFHSLRTIIDVNNDIDTFLATDLILTSKILSSLRIFKKAYILHKILRSYKDISRNTALRKKISKNIFIW